MVINGVMLQTGIAGFNELFIQLESLYFFRLILPFLLIFAVVYAILTKIPVFEKNKGAGVVAAVAIGLLSIQFAAVPDFFDVIFANFGIGLAILLVALILGGVFIGDDEKAYKWIFFGLGAIIFLVVTFTSLSSWSFVGSWWWDQYGAMIIVGLVVIGAIIGIIVASKDKKDKP